MARKLLDFINNSPTAYHAVDSAAKLLLEQGFTELKENTKWNLKKEGKYFLKKNNSAFIAFETGSGELKESGFKIICAHTDSPGFKIKPGNNIVKDGCIQLNTECYGGVILSSWFDRPLSVAGRLVVRHTPLRKEILVDYKKPVCIIPNLAIHFNREINDGYKYNKQTDTLPVVGIAHNGAEGQDYFLNLIATEAKVEKKDILDYELFLYECGEGILMGAEEELISAPRLDNLWMVYAGLCGLFASGKSSSTKVLAAFDNEEIGSKTAEGADSAFLRSVLNRISICLGNDEEEFFITLANSTAVSADAAHAVNPNYSGKHDPINRPLLGKGPVIKYSATKRYGTTALSASLFSQICEEAEIPYQKFVNRSDVIGGSSVGPYISSTMSIPVVDVGAPMLAMHSIRELGTVKDDFYITESFKRFYGMNL